MKKMVVLLLLICIGCRSKSVTDSVQISLIDGGKHLKISGIDYAIMQDINRDTTTNIWQNLIQVYRMPADTDLKDIQPMQPGKYSVKDSAVVFVPDTPLDPHQTYFMRYYQYDKGSSAWDYIKNHQRPGNKQYRDFTFKQ